METINESETVSSIESSFILQINPEKDSYFLQEFQRIQVWATSNHVKLQVHCHSTTWEVDTTYRWLVFNHIRLKLVMFYHFRTFQVGMATCPWKVFWDTSDSKYLTTYFDCLCQDQRVLQLDLFQSFLLVSPHRFDQTRVPSLAEGPCYLSSLWHLGFSSRYFPRPLLRCGRCIKRCSTICCAHFLIRVYAGIALAAFIGVVELYQNKTEVGFVGFQGYKESTEKFMNVVLGYCGLVFLCALFTYFGMFSIDRVRKRYRWYVMKDTYVAFFAHRNDTFPQEVSFIDDRFELYKMPKKAVLEWSPTAARIKNNHGTVNIDFGFQMLSVYGCIVFAITLIAFFNITSSSNNLLILLWALFVVFFLLWFVVALVTVMLCSITCWFGLSDATVRRQRFIDASQNNPNMKLWKQPHRYSSYAPIRSLVDSNNRATCYVDAEETWKALYEHLIQAKHEIFIAGWWICPDIYLLRPPSKHLESRIDRILYNKAMEGVKVYILMYQEIELALGLNSAYSKKRLLMHENIQVIRDPDVNVTRVIDVLWSHHEKVVCIDQSIAFVGGLDLCFGRYDNSDHALSDGSLSTAYTWVGKDYSNERRIAISNIDKPEEMSCDRNATHRMPWHDIHSSVYGDVALDVSRHFIHRWNMLCMAYQQDLYTGCCRCCRRSKLSNLETTCILPRKNLYDLLHRRRIEKDRNAKACNVQVLRSISLWSGNGNRHENSIHVAYLDVIRNAKSYIYIENQFFVSGVNGDRSVKNRIVQALIDRILRAIREGETFRVYIVLPLLPGFSGEFDTTDELRSILYYQYRALCRGGNSLFDKISQFTDNPHAYVAVYGLRTYGLLPNGTTVTEEIYIHSKLMIVDDEKIIVGSANVNDRSMLGDRDSEIAVLIEQDADTPTNDNVAHGLRMKLFREHLGLDSKKEVVVKLPRESSTWEFVKQVASENTAIYEEVFHVMPCDHIHSLNDITFELMEFDKVYIVENQYYSRFKGWRSTNHKKLKSMHLKTYRHGWTDFDGLNLNNYGVQYVYDSADWVVDKEKLSLVDENGWQYGSNFEDMDNHSSVYSNKDYKVRRRVWKRIAIGNDEVDGGNSFKASWDRLSGRLSSVSSSRKSSQKYILSESSSAFHKLSKPDQQEMRFIQAAQSSHCMVPTAKDSEQRHEFEKKLSRLQGHLVEFPLNFLRDENLNSKKRGGLILPKSLFT